MSYQNVIDQAAVEYSSAYSRAITEIIDEVLKLRRSGLPMDEILQQLAQSDMLQMMLNNMGDAIDQLMVSYERVLLNLSGFGDVSEATLDALVNLDRATFMGNLAGQAETIKQQLARALIAGESERVIEQAIFRNGVLRPDQVETLVNTSMNTFSRNVTYEMAKGMPRETKYFYQGPVDGRTRPICLEMVAAGELTRREIERSYPGAFVDGGGYNCRHRWTAVGETGKGNRDDAVRRCRQL